MKWFGESWGAPVNETVEHAETPVGELCSRCTGPIKAEDRGVIIPCFVEKPNDTPGSGLVSAWVDQPEHLACFQAEVLGPVKIEDLIERSSIGSAAWVECEQHGHQPVDPFKGGCLQCASEAERASRAAYYADDDPEHEEQWGRL